MECKRTIRDVALVAVNIGIRSVCFAAIISCVVSVLYWQNAAASDDSELKQILALEADVDYGEYLAGECLTCHQTADNDSPVPKIHGRPSEFIITMLLAYRDGQRDNETMQTVAKGLGQEEMASLGLYFSTLTEN